MPEVIQSGSDSRDLWLVDNGVGRVGLFLSGSPVSDSNKLPVDATVNATVDITYDYDEDSGHSTGDTGAFVLGVRNDNESNFTDTDLDYSPIAVDSAGRVKIDDDDIITELEGLDLNTDGIEALLTTIDADTSKFTFDTNDLRVKVNQSLPAGDNNIGNVDVASSALPTGAATESTLASIDGKDFATETTLGNLLTESDFDTRIGNVSATPTANTVLGRLKDIDDKITELDSAFDATDFATSAKQLADNHNVTANAGTNLNTSALALETTLQSIKTSVEKLDDIVSGNEAQVDVVGALPAGDNNIGNIDIASMPANITSSGSITAVSQTIELTPKAGDSAVGIQVTGTWSGQIEFEGTIDGTNWVAINLYSFQGTDIVQGTTTNNIFVGQTSALTKVRVRSSSWVSGTATVEMISSIGSDGTEILTPIPSGTNAIGKLAANSGVDIGDVTINNASGASAVNIQDGGNSITVDATALDIRALTNADVVTAELSATDNAVLDNIDTNQKYGDTANASGTTSVTASATSILSANADRKEAIIRNTDSLSAVFLGFDNAITTSNAPIRLAPGEMWIEDHSRTEIFGITSSGTVVVAKQEVEA